MKQNTIDLLNQLFNRYPALEVCKDRVFKSTQMIIDSYKSGGKLLVCGNGGSASDSEHIVGELMKGFVLPRNIARSLQDKLKADFPETADYLIKNLQGVLPAISLVSQTALSTAFANDNAPDLAFAQQVFGYGKEGDILLAISTSGNSGNVIYAAQIAKEVGVKVVALTGRTGGKLKALCDVLVNVPADGTYQVQEYHLPYYHALCLALENEFFGE